MPSGQFFLFFFCFFSAFFSVFLFSRVFFVPDAPARSFSRSFALALSSSCACSVSLVRSLVLARALARALACFFSLFLFPLCFFSSHPLSLDAICFSLCLCAQRVLTPPFSLAPFLSRFNPTPFLCPLSCACVLLMFLFILVCFLLQHTNPLPFL